MFYQYMNVLISVLFLHDIFILIYCASQGLPGPQGATGEPGKGGEQVSAVVSVPVISS